MATAVVYGWLGGRAMLRLPRGVCVSVRGLASGSGPIADRPYAELKDMALNQPDAFWGQAAKERLRWERAFNKVRDCDMDAGRISWFTGGNINVSVNCLDRHAERTPNKVALLWEKDTPGTHEKITYKELLELTCRMANAMRSRGVKKGDRVAIYLPSNPIAVASMLACARIGAVHTVVFAGFSAEALADRIRNANCETVITTVGSDRGGRRVELKGVVDEAVRASPCVKRVFLAGGDEAKKRAGPLDIPLEEDLAKQKTSCAPEVMDSEDPLFLLYTSGSTGKPKGLVHTQAGYLLYASLTHQFVFDHREGDVFGCVADIGWITGHSYVVYGPLCNGATTVLFESTPVYPDPGRYWETVQRLRINQFYGAPTAIRLLIKHGDKWVHKYDRSSLRILGSVGEPINTDAWEWYHKVVGEGRCALVDTWWQSETGGICISPRPSEPNAEIIPAMAMRPFLGIQPALLDDKGKVVSGNDANGALCIAQPWPGMARTIYGDHKRFVETYFKAYPGFYFSGDGAYRTKKGYYQITGRMDDVINISGHRLGTAEVEDAMGEHPDVAETAVVGCPHDIKGQGAYAFVILKESIKKPEDKIVADIRNIIATKIAKYAVPDNILVVKRLPKTRSGKIMRRLLRKIAANEAKELGDLTTLDDSDVIQEIVNGHNELQKKSKK
ncbi:acetyl-coenzyme A synthetase 2-like, mitochondrial [Lampetra fluviatilis]